MLRSLEKFDPGVNAQARERARLPARDTYEISLGRQRVPLGARTLLLGVLNVTPDSFSDGGRFLEPQAAILHAAAMVRAGADWVDVGGESTRPGAQNVSEEEELRRVLPVIRGIRKRLPKVPISIDTTKARVAEQAILAGASLINDVSGLRFDPAIAAVARRHRVPLVLMHIRGRPLTMQTKPFASSLWRSVNHGLAWSVQKALSLGVRRSQLIIDPGLGFGKSRRQNFEILAGLRRLRRFRLPVLVGASRKSFIRAVVAGNGLDPGRRQKHAAPAYTKIAGARAGGGAESEAVLSFGDAAAVTASILSGAHIVRVHDVAASAAAARIADAILAAASG